MKRSKMLFVAFAVSTILISRPICADNERDELDALREEVIDLKIQQNKIENEVSELRRMLQQALRIKPSQPKFEPKKIDIEGAPFLGDIDAPITFIEYTDYQCSYCGRHYDQVMPALIAKYVESGKMKYVIRANPLASIHPLAIEAAQAAFCANDQGAFWEMHDILFQNRDRLASADLNAFGEKIELQSAVYQDCLSEGKYKDRVTSDIASGQQLNVRGTPAFIVGMTDHENPNVAFVSEYISGARDLNTFSRTIESLLSKATTGN